jgi:hypothetical protein
MVAWSAAAGDAGEVPEGRVGSDSWLVLAGTGGRVGSVLGEVEGLPGWFGFHISFVLPFVDSWIQAPEQPCGTENPHIRANQAELLILSNSLARPKAGKLCDACSSLHLNHAYRKIEIPQSESFPNTGGLLTH